MKPELNKKKNLLWKDMLQRDYKFAYFWDKSFTEKYASNDKVINIEICLFFNTAQSVFNQIYKKNVCSYPKYLWHCLTEIKEHDP